MIPFILLILVGAFTGVLSGFLGIGGGALLVPAMLYYLVDKIDHTLIFLVASASSLAAAFVSSLFSSVRHKKNNNLHQHAILPLAFGAIIGNIPGSYLSEIIPGETLKLIFTVILIYISFKMILSKKKKSEMHEARKQAKIGMFIAGIFVGMFSALTGLGGGVLFVPILNIIFHFDIKKAAGTSAAVMIFNTFSAVLWKVYLGWDVSFPNFDISYGYLIPTITIPLIIGTALFSQLGAQLNYRMHSDNFKKVAGYIFLLMSARMIFTIL